MTRQAAAQLVESLTIEEKLKLLQLLEHLQGKDLDHREEQDYERAANL